MKRFLLPAVGCFLAVLAMSTVGLYRRSDAEAETGPLRKRRFSLGIAEGLSLGRHGLYGVELVRCGRCRIEKRKLGALTLGCFNVLVLDDLSVVIPPAKHGRAKTGGASASRLAERMGISRDFLRAQGCGLRFTGLRVNDLSVATLDAATNVVLRFRAERGEFAGDGLRLEKCDIMNDANIVRVDRAALKADPALRLVWRDGELRL